MKPAIAILIGCLCLTISVPVVEGAESVEIKQGEYRVVVSGGGIVVYYGETQLSLGSYFTVFKPKYEGSILSHGDFWKNVAEDFNLMMERFKSEQPR